jgi:DNA-binding transcriptional regulator YhcF (GntR family)
MGSQKIDKGNLGEVIGVLAKTIQRQYESLERDKDIISVEKKGIDNKKRQDDSSYCESCGKNHLNIGKKNEK